MTFSTLLLNLPNSRVITRRYMCSYNSPMSLFPPYELISLGGVVRSWKQQPVELIDAIAERLDRDQTLARIAALAPDLIVTIAGFECFDEDMQEIAALKQAFPQTPLVLFGHYPTVFPSEIIANTAVDYILLGEPDLVFSELYDALRDGQSADAIEGVVSRSWPSVATAEPKRIAAIRDLPLPAFELLPTEAYGEPALPRPFGMIQTARGCPYSCNYCVRSYGQRLTLKTVDQIIAEIRTLIAEHRIRSLRFIDDTFTLNRSRVLAICDRLMAEGITLQWTCLARTDNLDGDMLSAMKRAGCRRIYFGLESGSQRVLDLYEKNVDRDEAVAALRLCRDHGIETAGFFMMGLPFEEETDFAATIAFAHEAQLSYAAIAPLTLYPGTPLFDRFRDAVDFSLFPYRNVFRDPKLEERWSEWEKRFYRSFYLSPAYLLRNARALLNSPLTMLRLGSDVVRGWIFGGANAFNHLRPARSAPVRAR